MKKKFTKCHVALTTTAALILFVIGYLALLNDRPSEPMFALSIILFVSAASLNIQIQLDKIEEKLDQNVTK